MEVKQNNKFINGQANTFASYYDCDVLAVTDSLGHLAESNRRHKACLWFFADDEVPSGFNTKKMKFSEFVKMVIDEGHSHFAYYFSSDDWAWHTDAYPSFIKTALDEFLANDSIKEEYKRNYDFLFEDLKNK